MPVVTDALGRTVSLPTRPQRLVSLVPNLSELVHVLGRGDDLVGVTDFCVEPADGFVHAKRLRGTKNPDRTALIALAPDLVLANDEENRQHDVEQLEAAGMSVYVTKVRTLNDVATATQTVAQLLDCGPAGAAIAQAITAITPAQVTHRPRVFCPIWRDGAHRKQDETWWCVGPETYAGQLLIDAGFDLVAGDNDPRYPRLLLDDVRHAAPDLVLLPDEPYQFSANDAAVFDTFGPVTVTPYSGTDLFWWGHRTANARQKLHALADTLRQ